MQEATRDFESPRSAPVIRVPPDGRSRCLNFLSVVVGFGQGSCVNIYLSAGGYYGERLSDPRFFVCMCCCVYLAPFLVLPLARLTLPFIERSMGLRRSFHFRIVGTTVLAMVGVIWLAILKDGKPYEWFDVLGVGALLGLTTGTLASASAQFFGVVSPELVSLWFWGQTASAAYVNVVSWLTQFAPGCSHSNRTFYYVVGGLVAVLPIVLFLTQDLSGWLEDAFLCHEAAQLRFRGLDCQVEAPSDNESFTPTLSFVAFFCQVLSIALSLSLTPLANVLAHNDYHMGQNIVLVKLLGDFFGRSAFYAIPKPTNLKLHLSMNCVLQVARLIPFGLFLGEMWSMEPLLGEFTFYVIWFIYIATGALGGSWVCVVAIAGVSDAHKPKMARMMNVAVYLGFLSGLAFAIIATAATST